MKAALSLLLPGALILPLPAAQAQLAAHQPIQNFVQQPAQPAPIAQAPTSQVGPNNYSILMSAGADALVARKYVQAATAFQRAADLDPQSAQAQYWAGQALVYADRPTQAIYFLERAKALGSDSVALHLALVAAYAGALRPVERNRESALLQAWHADGQHASLIRADGFQLETIFGRPWHINVTEYFSPQHDDIQAGQPALWRFIVRDSAEIIEATYVLKAAPDLAGAQPKFLLLHYSGEAAVPDATSDGQPSGVPAPVAQQVKAYDKQPAYDQVRADVLQRVRSMPMLSKR